MRVDFRDQSVPSVQNDYIGFRCARSTALLSSQALPSPSPTPTIQEPPATNTPQSLAQLKTDSHGVKMALVSAGEFQMGTSYPASGENPIHTVYLDAFYMDIFEATNAHFAACVSTGVCSEPRDRSSNTRSSYFSNSDYTDYPVIYVTWEMAKTYCEWRGGSLPSEAQWEKAARGGLEGKEFPWGDENPICQIGVRNGANFGICATKDTEQVGSYSSNRYGLYDMAGNVWEWINDWYQADYYRISPASNPLGPATGTQRGMRSGSWNDSRSYLRVADRQYGLPNEPFKFLGFRCAAPLPGN